MEKKTDARAQFGRDMIDAIRAVMGMSPLYGMEPDIPCYSNSYMNGIGDGNKKVNSRPDASS